MCTFYLGLGSNQGNRLNNLLEALNRLKDSANLVKCSSVFETEPKYDDQQAKFLNMACEIETDLDVLDLFKTAKRIEIEIGRTPTHRNGPRLIDIDLLFAPDQEHSDEIIQLPHLRMHERAFVLVPLAEIASRVTVPRYQLKVQQMLDRLDSSLISEVDIFKGNIFSS